MKGMAPAGSQTSCAVWGGRGRDPTIVWGTVVPGAGVASREGTLPGLDPDG